MSKESQGIPVQVAVQHVAAYIIPGVAHIFGIGDVNGQGVHRKVAQMSSI